MENLETKKLMLIVMALLLLALGFGYKYIFPSDIDLIKAQFNHLEELASKKKGENKIQTVAKIRSALESFSLPVRIDFDNGAQVRSFTAQTQQELTQPMASAQITYPWLTLSLDHSDISVDGDQALSLSQARIDFQNEKGDRVYDLFAVKMNWEKIEGNWLIKYASIKPVDNT